MDKTNYNGSRVEIEQIVKMDERVEIRKKGEDFLCFSKKLAKLLSKSF